MISSNNCEWRRLCNRADASFTLKARLSSWFRRDVCPSARQLLRMHSDRESKRCKAEYIVEVMWYSGVVNHTWWKTRTRI